MREHRFRQTHMLKRTLCAITATALLATVQLPSVASSEGFCLDPELVFDAALSPEGIAAGDFNGDGLMDLVVANGFGVQVSLWLNAGNATFSEPLTIETVSYPSVVVALDIDADLDLDLAVASDMESRLCILRNQGNVTFSTAYYDLGVYPVESIVATDIDLDLDQDIVVGSMVSPLNIGSVVVTFLNSGNGTFSEEQRIPLATGIEGVSTGDLNADTYPDLAVCNSVRIAIFLNNGLSKYMLDSTYGVDQWPSGVCMVDLDSDHDLDLVTSNSGSDDCAVLLNIGNADFAAPTYYLAESLPSAIVASDMDNDLDNDVVVANFGGSSVSVFPNTGSGQLGPRQDFPCQSTAYQIASADLSGDGWNDIVTTNFFPENMSVLVNCADCRCLCHADPICDSVLSDVLDVVSAVNVAFRNGAGITDPGPTCPIEATDYDCSESTDVIDVVKVVNVAFRNANPATEYCDPCQ